MKTTFKYALTKEDYLFFEKIFAKRQFRSVLFPALIFVIYTISVFVRSHNFTILFFSFAVLLGIAIGYFVCIPALIKRKVKTYTNSDKSYFSPVEITIDDKKIESKKLFEESAAEIIGIYPYSIMRAIIENENYIYFYISNEVRILPKAAIPQEFKETVFSNIKKNTNYTYMK